MWSYGANKNLESKTGILKTDVAAFENVYYNYWIAVLTELETINNCNVGF